jgi:hypothetical protein
VTAAAGAAVTQTGARVADAARPVSPPVAAAVQQTTQAAGAAVAALPAPALPAAPALPGG